MEHDWYGFRDSWAILHVVMDAVQRVTSMNDFLPVSVDTFRRGSGSFVSLQRGHIEGGHHRYDSARVASNEASVPRAIDSSPSLRLSTSTQTILLLQQPRL